MRPQQQNRRMRGRNSSNSNSSNSNRKGPNPLTRNYESNGPDVKIRGSAQQIAEKYAQLARDAQSSGDRVMAENYLQHAEHYNRIIAAAQAQMPIQNVQQNRDMSDDDMDDERDEFDNFSGNAQQNPGNANANQSNGNALNNGSHEQPQQVNLGVEPQPVIEGVPAELALNRQRQEGRPRRDRNERFDRHDRRDRNDRGERGNRPVEADPAAESVAVDVAPAVVEAAPAAAPIAVIDEAQAAPRRGRKPRRAADTDAVSDVDADIGLVQTLSRGKRAPREQAPVADQDNAPAPVAVES